MGTGNPLILTTDQFVNGGNDPTFIPQAEPRKHRRSASQLENFLRCPEGYRLEKIVKAPRSPAAWLAQGTSVHDAIERWEATGRVYGEEEVRQWWRASWESELGKMLDEEPDLSKWLTGGRTKPENDIATREARAEAQALEYVNWAMSQSDRWRILEYLPGELAVEVPFSITLNGTLVVGYIDQIVEFEDGQVMPRDLKTGNKLPTSPRQLGVYKVAMSDQLGLDAQYGDFYMAKNTDTTKPYDLSRYTRPRVAKWFENLDAMVEQNRFIPNPGDACRICAVSRFCDLLGPEAYLYPVDLSTE